MIWELIGIGAACLTTFSFVPQIIRALRTKSVKDVSPVTLIQLSTGVGLWTLYGVHLKNPIIIAANSITLMTLVTLLVICNRYRQVKPK